MSNAAQKFLGFAIDLISFITLHKWGLWSRSLKYHTHETKKKRWGEPADEVFITQFVLEEELTNELKVENKQSYLDGEVIYQKVIKTLKNWNVPHFSMR